MQKLQRKAGLLLHRSADDAQVSLLLKDFEDGDKILKSIIESVKAFRIAWTELLQHASGMATDFDDLYQYIHGDPDTNRRYHAATRDQLAKAKAFKECLASCRDVIIQELADVERRVGGPAKETRKHIDAFRKIIKRREDRKLDFERYKSRTVALEQKSTRSERDNNALLKHQIDLDVSEKGYEVADDHLKQSLPGLTKAIMALIPQLVNSQCMIQNTLLGHYYTALHGFCQQYGYAIPSSEWTQVQTEFDDVFPRVKRDTETIGSIAKGKAITQPFATRPDSLQTRTVTHKNGIGSRSSSNGALPAPIPAADSMPPPAYDMSLKPTRTISNNSYSRPTPSPSVASFQTSSEYYNNAPSVAGSQRTPLSPRMQSGGLRPAVSSTSLASSVAAKKKPPPPPPKRKPSGLQQEYVVAQYDFAGGEAGDLPFREGDRIRIVKKTGSINDWWEGECGGRTGSFPANYCKPM
ncbi:SH3 domain-containing protein [Microthyrium microscopicum]|uniref:SH3 domain-containing protein n=1 Tax=Microthyrium microscopicum TaxID=703497 RepID=A0A6A6UT84_9PEZI|nr:SH3 domain-containing protein [Microthyrium microscopicum]